MLWTLLLLLFLYMLEGIPYGLQSRFLPLILRSKGLSLTALGFYKLLYIPWLFKSFYAPLVDTCLTKRLWLVISLTGLLSVSVTLSMADVIPQLPSEHGYGVSVYPLACCLFLYNFCAATQDISVDGLALMILSSSQLSAGNTIQVVGYKLGAVMGGGVLTTLASYIPFPQLLQMVAFVYFIGIILCSTSQLLNTIENQLISERVFPVVEPNNSSTQEVNEQRDRKSSRESGNDDSYLKALKASIAGSISSRRLIVLLLLYKLGEQGAMNMLPLLLFDRGISLAKVGLWTGLMGQIFSVAGSTAGYKFLGVGRSSISTLFLLMIVRAFTQAPLVLIAIERFGQIHQDMLFAVGTLCMNATLFVSGAVTTVMFTLMMQCTRAESDWRTQATHYTILSTAELLGKLVFGLIAAPFTDLVGYAWANLLFLVLSILPVWFAHVNRTSLTFTDKHNM